MWEGGPKGEACLEEQLACLRDCAKIGVDLMVCHVYMGISSYDGRIFWTDDLHLLPFDGIADWQGIAKRLKKCSFDGPLTFEFSTKSKPDRHENDVYAHLPSEEYLAAAYTRACKAASLCVIK